MKTLADRFRRWYDYERDCNVQSLACSPLCPRISETRRSSRRQSAAWPIWSRPGSAGCTGSATGPSRWPRSPPRAWMNCPSSSRIPRLAWTAYLSNLTDADLAREFEYKVDDGRRFRWNIEGLLTQVFGHAWYHRGQIAQLVALLGGKAVDTDYIFFDKPKQL